MADDRARDTEELTRAVRGLSAEVSTLARGAVRGADQAFAALGGTIRQSLGAGVNTAAQMATAVSDVGGALKSSGIPGVQQFGAALNLVGQVWQTLNAEAERMRAQSATAFASVVTGAQSMQTALGGERINTFTRRLRELVASGTEFGEAFRRARGEADQLYATLAAMVSVQNMQQRNDETIQEFAIRRNNRLNEIRGTQVSIARQTQNMALLEQRRAAFTETAAAAARERGATAGEVAATVQREAEVFDLASQFMATGMAEAEAVARARGTLAERGGQINEAMLRTEREQARGRLAEQNRADRQSNLVQSANLILLRQQAQTGDILVERTQDRQQAQDQYNRGLITAVQLQERLNQITTNERAERAVQVGQQVNQLLDQQRTPLQRLVREQERLNALRGELAARPGGEAAAGRASADALRTFITSSTFREQFVGAMEEGSVAAATAVARAEAQLRVEDPAVALRRAVEVNNELMTRRLEADRQLLEAFARLRAEGAL